MDFCFKITPEISKTKAESPIINLLQETRGDKRWKYLDSGGASKRRLGYGNIFRAEPIGFPPGFKL